MLCKLSKINLYQSINQIFKSCELILESIFLFKNWNRNFPLTLSVGWLVVYRSTCLSTYPYIYQSIFLSIAVYLSFPSSVNVSLPVRRCTNVCRRCLISIYVYNLCIYQSYLSAVVRVFAGCVATDGAVVDLGGLLVLHLTV